MLELIRRHKTLFSVIFVLSAVGLVISMFSNPGSGDGTLGIFRGGAAAKVEGEEISTRQLVEGYSRRLEQAQQMMSAQLQGTQDAAQRQFLEQLIRSQVSPDRVLEEMIQQKFLISTSRQLGIKSSPEGVRSLIESNEAFQEKGRFDPILYRQRVRQPGLFEKEIAYQNQFMTLSKTIRQALALQSPQEEAQKAKLSAKRNYETLSVNPILFPEPKSLSQEEVKKFRESPEWTKASQDFYNRNISEFKNAEQVKAAHILIRENEGGLEKAKEVRNEIVSGKLNFEEAARKYSSDKANSEKGGDLGYFEKEAMDPAFSTAAFALSKEKDLSEPVKSSFGYHLIKFQDRKAAAQKNLAEVADQIAPRVALEAAKAARAQAFMKRFAEGNRPSDAEIRKLGLQWVKQTNWSPLDTSFGSLGSIDFHLEKVLALGAQSPYLRSPISVGPNLVMIRWSGNAAPTNEATPTNDQALSKSDTAFEYYLKKRFEGLEKSGKIKRSAQVLNQLRQQTNPN